MLRVLKINNNMIMETFQKKTLEVSRGYTYTYYTLEGDTSLPPLFFHHGWPDHAQMWEGMATRLKSSDINHPMIIPDLLGYDGTSKPTDPAEYKWDAMMKDLIEIIDAEGHEKVISIGHDWGSVSAARLYNFYPDRVAGLVLLNVVYLPPMRNGFDLDAVNNMTEQAFGYPIYSYWHFFTAPDAPAALKGNLERLYQILHAQGSDGMKRFFCVPDAFRDYLTKGGEDFEIRPYAKDTKFKEAFIKRMSRDGFEGPQNWYIATKDNLQTQCDKELPEGRDKINVPVLYIGSKDDAVCRPENMGPAKEAGLLPDLEETPIVDSAHWVSYERPDEVAGYLGDWLKKRYAS